MTRLPLAAALAAAVLIGAPAAGASTIYKACTDTRHLTDTDIPVPYFDGCVEVYEAAEGGTCVKVYGDVNGSHRRFGCVE